MSAATLNIGSVLVGCSKNDYWMRPPGSYGEAARLDLLAHCVEQAITAGCQVVVLPAGFFIVASYAEQHVLEQTILAQLEGKKILVAFGIDVRGNAKPATGKRVAGKNLDDKSTARKAGATPTQGLYDLFGYVVEQGRFLIHRIRQTGIRTGEVTRTIDAAEQAARSAVSPLLGGAKVGLLMCGEVRSSVWHDAMHAIAPDLVVHLAHASVVLGGTSKESWTGCINGLMQALPAAAVWAFADHIQAMRHWDSASGPVPLVRRGDGRVVPVPSPRPVAHEIPATMYIHATA